MGVYKVFDFMACKKDFISYEIENDSQFHLCEISISYLTLGFHLIP